MNIAVITVTYNRKEYCEKAVSKLLEQLKKRSDLESFKIFIYDNASQDGTVDYLKQLESKESNVEAIYGDENLGTAGGYKALLESKIFGAGFDYILKNDDDEILPDDWVDLLKHWNRIEALDVLMAGFKRSCTNEYFEGLEWISRNPEHMTPIYLDDNECYLSYITAGPQIATEIGWQAIFNALSDYGEKFGGWDVSIAKEIARIGKKCLVVYNKECLHFQRWEDHPDYTKEKFEQIARVRKKLKKKNVSK